MEEMIDRAWSQIVGRGQGLMTFRLVLQPLVAVFWGVRSGLRDAREGQGLYFWAIIFDRARRRELIRHGWIDVGTLFMVAIVLDVVYQLIAFRWVYPLQSLYIAVLLAILPYLFVRGLTHRIGRRFRR